MKVGLALGVAAGILATLITLSLTPPITGQSQAVLRVEFLGEAVPVGGIRNIWHIYCDRIRGHLIYFVPQVGAQYSIAVVPNGCEKT